MIFGIGTSCPPSITLLAMRAALIAGLLVDTKNKLIKNPSSLARLIIVYLLWDGKDGLKYQALLFSEAFFTQTLAVADGFHHSFLTVPVAELLLCNNVRVNVNGILQPFVMKNLRRNSRYCRTHWARQ